MFSELSDKNKQKIFDYFSKTKKYSIFIKDYLDGKSNQNNVAVFETLPEVEEMIKLCNDKKKVKGSLIVQYDIRIILSDDFVFHLGSPIKKGYKAITYNSYNKSFNIFAKSGIVKKYTFSYES